MILPKNHKYKRCSTCQNVAQILTQYLAQDYSFTLSRILNTVCALIEVEVQGEMFPGCGQARRISWDIARHCGKHLQPSAQNVRGLCKFKN